MSGQLRAGRSLWSHPPAPAGALASSTARDQQTPQEPRNTARQLPATISRSYCSCRSWGTPFTFINLRIAWTGSIGVYYFPSDSSKPAILDLSFVTSVKDDTFCNSCTKMQPSASVFDGAPVPGQGLPAHSRQSAIQK